VSNVRQRTSSYVRSSEAAAVGRDADKEGSEAMITLHPNDADTADLMFSERRVSLGWVLAGLVFGGNVASAVLMLLGQG